jgi:hypothetical protein
MVVRQVPVSNALANQNKGAFITVDIVTKKKWEPDKKSCNKKKNIGWRKNLLETKAFVRIHAVLKTVKYREKLKL